MEKLAHVRPDARKARTLVEQDHGARCIALPRARLRREELTDEPIEVVDFTPDAAAMLAATGTRARVLDALSELDPELRFVLVSHDLDETPMTELAVAAGLPLSTLYKRRARALAELRDALERRAAEEARMVRRRGRK